MSAPQRPHLAFCLVCEDLRERQLERLQAAVDRLDRADGAADGVDVPAAFRTAFRENGA